MKSGQVLGIVLILGCFTAAGLALRGTVRKSLTVQEVKASPGEPCGIYGQVVTGSARYSLQAERLDFQLKDDKGDAIPVVYLKPKPANFDQATHVKAMGAYRDGAFQADELILKCPSKYIRSAPVPGKPGPEQSRAPALQRFFARLTKGV